jgi:hypothetical protein
MTFLERITNIENDIENNFKPKILNILEDLVDKSINNSSNNKYVISELIIKKMYNIRIDIDLSNGKIYQKDKINYLHLTCNNISSIIFIDIVQPFEALSHVIDILHKNTKNIIDKYLHKYFAGMNIEFHKLKDWLEHPEHRLVYEYTISK